METPIGGVVRRHRMPLLGVILGLGLLSLSLGAVAQTPAEPGAAPSILAGAVSSPEGKPLDGIAVSALQHILGGQKTIPEDRGIFLPTTHRMAPSLCRLSSELYYERRLFSKKDLEHQKLQNAGDLGGSGLWYVEVDHDGNRNQSLEEVDVVAALINRLTSPGVTWTDENQVDQPLGVNDILIVAPYNSQVNRLAERLPAGARIGTVDKFQGQEAPVVIYSLATSRPEDAPRGMEFLYSPNRLNVATSRARCAVILVASPHLFQPECRSVRQIKLANGLCRFRELATSLAVGTREQA